MAISSLEMLLTNYFNSKVSTEFGFRIDVTFNDKAKALSIIPHSNIISNIDIELNPELTIDDIHFAMVSGNEKFLFRNIISYKKYKEHTDEHPVTDVHQTIMHNIDDEQLELFKLNAFAVIKQYCDPLTEIWVTADKNKDIYINIKKDGVKHEPIKCLRHSLMLVRSNDDIRGLVSPTPSDDDEVTISDIMKPSDMAKLSDILLGTNICSNSAQAVEHRRDIRTKLDDILVRFGLNEHTLNSFTVEYMFGRYYAIFHKHYKAVRLADTYNPTDNYYPYTIESMFYGNSSIVNHLLFGPAVVNGYKTSKEEPLPGMLSHNDEVGYDILIKNLISRTFYHENGFVIIEGDDDSTYDYKVMADDEGEFIRINVTSPMWNIYLRRNGSYDMHDSNINNSSLFSIIDDGLVSHDIKDTNFSIKTMNGLNKLVGCINTNVGVNNSDFTQLINAHLSNKTISPNTSMLIDFQYNIIVNTPQSNNGCLGKISVMDLAKSLTEKTTPNELAMMVVGMAESDKFVEIEKDLDAWYNEAIEEEVRSKSLAPRIYEQLTRLEVE